MKSNNSSTTSNLPIGCILGGKYKIIGYIASGGFGKTYLAEHISLQNHLVIKEFFLRDINGRDTNSSMVTITNSDNINVFNQQKTKFKKEAVRLSKLNHSNIVKVHDMFECNGTVYYTMDYIDGEDLARRVERIGSLSEKDVVFYIYQITSALVYLHSLSPSLYHLDIKPSNIMLNSDCSKAFLIDFGASKNIDKNGITISSLAYTRGYAPSEQENERWDYIGAPTDFYALGATMYNLLTGARPPLYVNILEDRSINKSKSIVLGNSVSAPVRNLIVWLMSYNCKDRPQNGLEILKYIEDNNLLGGGEPTPPNPTPPKPIPPKPIPPKPKPKPEPIPEPDPPIKKEINLKRILIILCLIVFCALIGYFIYSKKQDDQVLAENVKQSTSLQRIKVKDMPWEINYKAANKKEKCKYTGEAYIKGTDTVPDGEGKLKFDNGDYFDGTMAGGNMQGKKCVFKLSSGDVFEGEMDKNFFKQGSYLDSAKNEIYRGTFKNGELDNGKWFDKKTDKVITKVGQ